MASRPPDNAPDPVRGRSLFLSLQRLIGAGLIMLGMLALNGALDWGQTAGVVLVVVGVIDFAVVPILLARRWRTPKP